MTIESYNINMQASNSFVQKHEKSVNANFFTQSISQNQETKSGDINTLKTTTLSQSKFVFNEEDGLSIEDKIKKKIIELLLEQVTNKKDKVHLYPKGNHHHGKADKTEHNPYEQNIQSQSNLWGFVYESKEEYYQKSSVEFNTQATIKTSNGEINIDLSFSYTQEFYEVHKTSIQMGTANFEDPLLINFEGNKNAFDNISKKMNFEFDINSDGIKEEIPQLKNGSGFLALDKNNNGIIDNGSELFGPTSGDGFQELAQYDENKNNWIDEKDSIFKDLRVWEKNENADNSLISLSQAGVGAIYLASVATNFNYSKSIGDDNAKLKQSSFFLKENGEAELITSVDFVI
jgi:hypothetical protein